MNREKFCEWWYSTINFCGCGSPSDVVILIRDYLVNASDGKTFFDEPYISGNERTNWFVLYSLDAWGLTDHGCGVRGSWLTDKGREMADYLASLTDDEIDTLLDDQDGEC